MGWCIFIIYPVKLCSKSGNSQHSFEQLFEFQCLKIQFMLSNSQLFNKKYVIFLWCLEFLQPPTKLSGMSWTKTVHGEAVDFKWSCPTCQSIHTPFLNTCCKSSTGMYECQMGVAHFNLKTFLIHVIIFCKVCVCILAFWSWYDNSYLIISQKLKAKQTNMHPIMRLI